LFLFALSLSLRLLNFAGGTSAYVNDRRDISIALPTAARAETRQPNGWLLWEMAVKVVEIGWEAKTGEVRLSSCESMRVAELT